MTLAPKRKSGRKPKRRVRPEEPRLASAVARDLFLRKQDRDLKAHFDAADKDGKAALKRRDLSALTEAIRREGKAISEHVRLTRKKRRT